jgi:glutamate/tyrosine decarboxylase-like PLP-dependent enzyme
MLSWPEEPRDVAALLRVVSALPSPYRGDPPAFSYPGTVLDEELLAPAGQLLAKQLNTIGTHTRGGDGEGGFEAVQLIEAAAIGMLAGVLGGTADTVDGFFCGGGTEANLQGMWMGREWLRRQSGPPARDICVITSPHAHYSIAKAAGLLDLGGPPPLRRCRRCGQDHRGREPGPGFELVATDERGALSVDAVEGAIRRRLARGTWRFLIVPTVGTTALGSIDPVARLGTLALELEATTAARIWLHVDASFGGFTVPFVAPQLPIGFGVPSVRSIALDGDKMGQLPYPAGVFLCRKDLQDVVARPVTYLGGHADDTVPGSRSCLAPVLAWLQFQRLGRSGQRRYVQACLDGRDRLAAALREQLADRVEVLPCSPWVNLLPFAFRTDRIDEARLAPYQLRHDLIPGDPADPGSCPRRVVKLCVMPHTLPFLERFVEDMGRALGPAS